MAMTTVLMDRRQPAKTMAWMLVLIFAPAVGVVLYIFFGQNIRKERIISQNSLDQLTKRSMLEFAEQNRLMLPDKHRQLISLFTNQNGAMPFFASSTSPTPRATSTCAPTSLPTTHWATSLPMP